MNVNDKMTALLRMTVLLLSVGVTIGCASQHPRDPLEPMNRAVYGFNDKADRYVMKPVAEGYRAVTPQPVRNGVNNFFNNLDDIGSAMNYSLQAQAEPAFYCFSRFVLNSTAGVLGVLDVTGEEQRRFARTGFGDTFARWGWKDSSYLVLPLLGPSTVRDGTGTVAASSFQRAVVFDSPHQDVNLTVGAVNAVSTRERLLGLEESIEGAALDPYTYTRDGWLQMRAKTTGDTAAQAAEDDIDIDDLVQ